jgi:tRNA nucleotidyltransferase (CCA-adding enzyme)
MAVRGILLSRFHVIINGLHLEADVGGESVDVARHEPAVEVKGATLTELHVGEDASGLWTAQCIVDV